LLILDCLSEKSLLHRRWCGLFHSRCKDTKFQVNKQEFLKEILSRIQDFLRKLCKSIIGISDTDWMKREAESVFNRGFECKIRKSDVIYIKK